MKRTCLTFLLLTAVTVGAGAQPLTQSRAPNPTRALDFLQIQSQVQRRLDAAREATLSVAGIGSGVIVSPDGLALTAAHVALQPGRRIRVRLADGRRVEAETLGTNHLPDVAALRLRGEGPWPFAPLADRGAVQLGEWCFGLGHPGGWDGDRGMVLRVGRVIQKRALFTRTDCQIIGGDSGGPLFDLDGRVIGIHSRVSEDSDENYHSTLDAIHDAWDGMLAGLDMPEEKGFLGVSTGRFRGGLRIDRVFEGTPAESANLKRGDIITHVGDRSIRVDDEFMLELSTKVPGDEVTLRLLREGQEQTVKVQLSERPES